MVIEHPSFTSDRAATRYWWVNHGRSYKRERGEGYIWCPQVGKNDRHRESWVNVSKVRPGDIVFSYAKQRIGAVGIAKSGPFDSQPRDGYAANGWSKLGWEVSIDWLSLAAPLSPKAHVDSIAPLLPSRHSPLRPNGNATLTYLSEMPPALAIWLIRETGYAESFFTNMAEQAEIENLAVPATIKLRLYNARVGQGTFRDDVYANEKRCRLTGISDLAFLIASHIKPWSASDNSERLDGQNGLMLAPHVDKLFDKGWISFEDNGDLIVDPAASHVLQKWGLPPAKNVGSFSKRQCFYLEYHRAKVFGKKAPLATP